MATKEEIQKMKDGIKALEIEGRKISDDPKWNTPEGDKLLADIDKSWRDAKAKLVMMLKE